MNLRKTLLSLTAMAALVALLAGDGRITAQEKKKEVGKAAAQKKVAKKPRGRLPAYFSAVVDAKQRADIYALQAKYQADIKKLEQQLAELKGQLAKEVDAVLTPEQLTAVKKKRDEAASKKKGGRKGAKKPAAEKASK